MIAVDHGATNYILMIVIWLLVVGLGIWLLVHLFPGNPEKRVGLTNNQKRDVTGSAFQILTKRYVRGEISKEQFDEMRRELEQ